ncbi:hypothetical protein SALBM217S_06455 [Streptomyces griseoloalbus]
MLTTQPKTDRSALRACSTISSVIRRMLRHSREAPTATARSTTSVPYLPATSAVRTPGTSRAISAIASS